MDPIAAAAAAAAAAVDASVPRKLWLNAWKEALLATCNPFMVCLAAGGLELEVFQRYIAQGIYFLRAFAQAYEVAEDCADDDDASAALRSLRKSFLKEAKQHSSVLEEWGIDVTKDITPSPATVKYTNFLLATAAGKIEGSKGHVTLVTPFEKTKVAAYTVAAMTPYLRLYAFLGKEMQKLDSESNHPYRKCIEAYCSPELEALAFQIEELLDKLSVALTGEELEVIEKLYRHAIKLEIEFFCSQTVDQQTVVPLIKLHNPSEQQLILFSDFDLTWTAIDSSAILAELAIRSASRLSLPETESDEPQTRKSSSDLRCSWDALSKQYTEEYEQCIENILSTEVKEFDYEGLCKALERVGQFEKQANSRVCEYGVLKGMNKNGIKLAGKHMVIQEGCRNFFQSVVARKEKLNAEVHMLSYCWCGDLIRSALTSGDLGVVYIYTNDLAYEESISTGDIKIKMETPEDKLRTFKDILSKRGRQFSVFVGGSVGDLLCLLEADVGIVVGSSESLRRVGHHYGVVFAPLFPDLVKKQRQLDAKEESPLWKKLSGVLYTVSGWAEIHAFILGC